MRFNKYAIYIVIIIALLLLPAITLNFKNEQVSSIDNKMLIEWNEVKKSDNKIKALEQYIQDRIGFRESAIGTYISVNQNLFHYLTDPRRMYGKDGHMFFADQVYIDDYQHINLERDKSLCDSMVDFLCRTQEYCASKDIAFIYCLVPDKKTIYSEYFPDCYNIYGDVSRTDYLLEKLQASELDYVYPKEELLECKENEVVYYKEYDPTHWNAHGAFIGQELVMQHIQEYNSNIDIPRKKDFEISYDLITTTANIKIHEEIPVYTLAEPIDILDQSSENPLNAHSRYFSHYINTNIPNNPKILVFCDSYFYNLEMYYYNQFSEVTFLHNSRNIKRIQEFIDYYEPDIVLFENVERVLSVDYSTDLLDSISF